MKRSSPGIYTGSHARPDQRWQMFANRAGDVFDLLVRIVLAPFRVIAAIWRFGARAAFGFIDCLFTGFMGFVGLGAMAMVAYALYIVLLQPLFRH